MGFRGLIDITSYALVEFPEFATVEIASGGAVGVEFTSTTIDTDGYHSETVDPDRLTVKTDGLYLVGMTWVWLWDSGNPKVGQLYARIVGGAFGGEEFAQDIRDVSADNIAGTVNAAQTLSVPVLLEEGQHVRCLAQQNAGEPLDLFAGRFWIARLNTTDLPLA